MDQSPLSNAPSSGLRSASDHVGTRNSAVDASPGLLAIKVEDNQRREPLRRHHAMTPVGVVDVVQQSSSHKRQRDDTEASRPDRILDTYDVQSAECAVSVSTSAGEGARAPVALPGKTAKRLKVEQPTKPDGEVTKGKGHSDGVAVSASRNGEQKAASQRTVPVIIFPYLPPGAEDNNRWLGVFVPTLLKFLGSRQDPFAWKDECSVSIVQVIWDAVYADRIKWTVRSRDLVHAMASRAVVEWREKIRKAGILAFDMYFKSVLDFPTNGRRQDYCSAVMVEGRLFYAVPDDTQGLYRSRFVLPPLHQHLKMIKGATDVPKFLSKTGYDHPYTAIGLAAAAAYCAASLWRHGKVSYDKHGMPIIVKTVYESTNKETREEIAFHSLDFQRIAAQCTASARKLPPSKLVEIVLTACEEGALPERKALPYGSLEELANDDFALLVDFE